MIDWPTCKIDWPTYRLEWPTYRFGWPTHRFEWPTCYMFWMTYLLQVWMAYLHVHWLTYLLWAQQFHHEVVVTAVVVNVHLVQRVVAVAVSVVVAAACTPPLPLACQLGGGHSTQEGKHFHKLSHVYSVGWSLVVSIALGPAWTITLSIYTVWSFLFTDDMNMWTQNAQIKSVN